MAEPQPHSAAADGYAEHDWATGSGEAMLRKSELPPNRVPWVGNMPDCGPGNDVDVPPGPTSAIIPPLAQGVAPLEGQLLSSPLTSSDIVPANNQDLILKMWSSLTWNKTGQVCVIIVVVGITAALLFWGLGRLRHALIGTPTAWSTIGGLVGGGGTGALTYVATRNRRVRRQSEQDSD